MNLHPDLWLFATLVFGVVLLPGMDMAFVAGSAVTTGLRAGLAAVAGIMVAGQVHLVAGVVGLAALLLLWPGAQAALLLAGAAYMAWIGWTILRSTWGVPSTASAATPAIVPGAPIAGTRQAFFRAAATCLMNPKAYAFTLAVLPSFIHTPERSTAAQALAMGGIIAINQALIYGAVALMAAGARPWLKRRERAQAWTARGVGALLIASAGAMAVGAATAAPAAAAPASTPSHSSTDRSPAMSSATATLASTATADPVHDFDFLIGRWQSHNRKLRAPLTGRGAAEADWEEFDTELETSKLPDGINNVDRFSGAAWRPGYVGTTLRIYNPTTKLWGLYSFDTRGNGFDPKTSALLPPVIGRFEGDSADFEGPDEFKGQPITVRYHWQRLGTDRALWQQSFSTDGGKTWEVNWICHHQRVRA
jgi:threonine/homoserine/homoserine lactone efflux protein